MQTTSRKQSKADGPKSPEPAFKPNLLLVFGLLSIVCGAVAVARVFYLILTVGGNNLSNDYLDVVPAIDRAFSGQISASNFLSSLKVGQHFVALPVLFHLAAAYLFDWNARAELLIGVGLNAIKNFLIFVILIIL